ncbi:hypothetical protein D9619_010687 [Psilocybe cf. subviscida]|uniref:HAM1-like N-terminal domain-containing protein n=1 Tax=Psilocybe cf. subviscida TaxID=2480587 RepID=A0A8H5EZT2_9AGAR|nr:hypothetical protein D9619_010687 [Psilocybe cf. subviscida]
MDYCLPCFSKSKGSDGEREPLLPKPASRDAQLPHQVAEFESSARPTVDKIVDVLAAFNAGKLPTQDQIARFLQYLLNSELLKEDDKALHGRSPLTKQSRKVVRDANGLMQALLQFGLEKNNDDQIQELFFKVKQIDVNHPTTSRFTEPPSESKVLDAPLQEQIAFDSSTLLSSIRTLVETSLTSPLFRVALCDLFAIAEDIAAHAAADVGHAAGQLQEIAETVEQRLRDNDIIGSDANGNPKLDASINDIKGKGKEAVDSLQNAEEIVKKDVQALRVEALDITKEKTLERIQQVLVRVQKDAPSRGAMKAIIILVHKYSQKAMEAAQKATEAVVENASLGKEVITDVAGEGSQGSSNYPPQPYASTKENRPFFDGPTDGLLQGFKEVLQRIAKGHSLDGLIAAVATIIDNLKDAPSSVNQEISSAIDDKMAQSATSSDFATQPPSPVDETLVARQPGLAAPTSQPGKKSKKNKKARAREKKALEKQLSDSITPTTSQDGLSPAPSQSGNVGFLKPIENPIRVYFSRLGAFLDRALDEHERGWAASKEGSKALEALFDDGVNLLNAVGEVVSEAGDDIPDDKSASSPTMEAGAKTSSQGGDDGRNKFKEDLATLFKEVDAYISAVRRDTTTMKLLRLLEIFGEDLSGLVSKGAKSGSSKLMRNVASLGSWSSWVGWTIPRVLRMLPSGVIPIPSIEVKSGKVEAALHALFVQSLARGQSDAVEASLVPDSVVLKESTEVKIDMADEPETRDATSSFLSPSEPEVQTTSRVMIHMDGVRAKVDNMGYYFKYNGDIMAYEDEGLLDVDVGMHNVHEGLSADIELELETEASPFDSEPEDEDINAPANLDVQETLSGAAAEADRLAAAQIIQSTAEPLFHVVGVNVDIPGLQFRINKSRHWILNKLCLQRLAGPIVARVARQAIEDKLRSALEVMSFGLGAVIQSAKQRRAERQKLARKIEEERQSGDEEFEAEEGLVEILSDWWSAVLEMGPAVLGRDYTPKYNEFGEEIDVDVQTTHDITTTKKGLIVTSQSTTIEQPKGIPAMVYHPSTRNFETVDLPVTAIGGERTEVIGEETVIAVGDGAQLFPGKGGAYGATGETDERGFVDHVAENVEGMVHGASNTVKIGVDVVEDVQDRFKERAQKESRTKAKTWKSKAFDF